LVSGEESEDPRQAEKISMNVPVLLGSLVGALYASLCLAVGSRVLLAGERWIDREPPIPAIARAATSFGLGHALMGTTWLCLALVGALTRPLVLAVSGTLLLVCLGPLRGILVDLSRLGRKSLWAAGRSRVERALLILLACVGGLLLVRALIPPKLDDPLQIYLVTPKVLAATGRLTFQPFNHHVVYPLLTEMNQAAVLTLSNETAATTFDSFIGINLLLALVALAGEVEVGATGALLAPLIVLTSSGFTNLFGSCKVDISVAQYAALAMLFAFRARHLRRGDVALSGLFSGAALAVKYTAVILLPGVAVILFTQLLKGGRGKRPRLLRDAALVATLGFCLLFLPQMIKNVILVQNPVAPFFSRLFATSTTYWAKMFAAEYTVVARLSGFDLWSLPLTLTYASRSNMLGNISPLFIGLIPALAWTGFPHARQKYLALAALVMVLTWMLIDPRVITPRFVFPPLVALAVVGAAVGEQLLNRRIARPAMLLCMTALSALLLLEMRAALYGVRYAGGVVTRSSFYLNGGRQEIHYSVAEYLRNHELPGTRVFLDGLEYLYFLDTDILIHSQTRTEMQRASEGCTARDAVIRKGGFSWLVVRADQPVCQDPVGFEVAFRSGPVVVLRSVSVIPANSSEAKRGHTPPAGA
jgi:hypothetical protein